jgi:hypothetical protein
VGVRVSTGEIRIGRSKKDQVRTDYGLEQDEYGGFILKILKFDPC